MTNDDVMSLELNGIARDTDTISGSGRAGNRDIGCANPQNLFEGDNPRHIKNDDSWTSRFAGLAETARSSIVEILHHKDTSPATTKGIHSSSPSTWKRWNF